MKQQSQQQSQQVKATLKLLPNTKAQSCYPDNINPDQTIKDFEKSVYYPHTN
jgi:hypothetical protein